MDGHAGEDSEGDSDDEHDHEEEEELLRYHMQRVRIRPELVDLTDLVSVRRCAGRLLGEASEGGGGDGDGGAKAAGKIPKLDVVIWNAGIGGWLGINTLQGIWGMATDLVETVTRPTFKIGSLGKVCRPLCERYPVTTSAGSRAGTGVKRQDGVKMEMETGMLEKSQQTHPSTTIIQPEKETPEPPLGEIFTANVFGHYMLGHYLSPLISKGCPGGIDGSGGRIIWISSLEADLGAFDANVDTDIMGLKSSVVYEDMKRLVDLLALTADLQGTTHAVDGYFGATTSRNQLLQQDEPPLPSHEKQLPRRLREEEATHQQHTPKMYTTHPGICMSEILPQPIYIKITTFFILWLARLLGSIWHPIQPYKGAVSAVWVALADAEMLEGFGDDNRAHTLNSNSNSKCKDEDEDTFASGKTKSKGKYGSATTRLGTEYVSRTEVDGWGYDGTVQHIESNRLGRWRDAVDLTEERRVEFEEAGRKVWKRMEELRVEWEGRVEDVIRRLDEKARKGEGVER